MDIESWIMSIIGVLLTYYLYRKSIKEPIACYSINSMNVIDADRSASSIGKKLTLNYEDEDKPVSRLCAANITFWNGGNLLLERETLLQSHPLRISLKSGEILEATIVTNPNSECDCRILSAPVNYPNSVPLDFKFLDRGNGIVVRVLHTGLSSEIEVVGKLKGVRLENAWSTAKAASFDTISKAFNYV
jgi:hypothetical protein